MQKGKFKFQKVYSSETIEILEGKSNLTLIRILSHSYTISECFQLSFFLKNKLHQNRNVIINASNVIEVDREARITIKDRNHDLKLASLSIVSNSPISFAFIKLVLSQTEMNFTLNFHINEVNALSWIGFN